MKEIDWTQEPEATHFYNGCRDWVPQWIKAANGDRYYKIVGGPYWVDDEIPLPLNQCIPRPTTHIQPAWNGEGLPPVGTVCALTPLTGETVTVTIKYMGEDWAVVQKGNKECVQALGLCTFRLIRTPEQVAAKEREQVIAEMRLLILRTNDSIQAAINLYDAGFRKVKP